MTAGTTEIYRVYILNYQQLTTFKCVKLWGKKRKTINFNLIIRLHLSFYMSKATRCSFEKPQILSQFLQALPQGKVKSHQWLMICPRSQNINMMDSKSRRTFFTATCSKLEQNMLFSNLGSEVKFPGLKSHHYLLLALILEACYLAALCLSFHICKLSIIR